MATTAVAPAPSKHTLVEGTTEMLFGRLYFVCLQKLPKSNSQVHYFSVGEEMVYIPFFYDFGPLNLGHLYRFCVMIDTKMQNPKYAQRQLCFVASQDVHSMANAAFLISAYILLRHNKTPVEAYAPISKLELIPFRDASMGPNMYPLTVLDFLQGLTKARECGFFDFDTFDINEYDYYEQVENGDLNWIVPNKLLAFCGPTNTRMETPDHGYTLAPEDFVEYFVLRNVTAVVRLNKKVYDRKRFLKAGLNHYDLFFPDGDSPPEDILLQYLTICEHEPGSIAVHCKAGLGRTGTLNGAYIMKHYGFTAKECIAWMRICRPGSVIGPQQHYLEEIQEWMWEEGKLSRASANTVPSSEGPQVTSVKHTYPSLTTLNQGATHTPSIPKALAHHLHHTAVQQQQQQQAPISAPITSGRNSVSRASAAASPRSITSRASGLPGHVGSNAPNGHRDREIAHTLPRRRSIDATASRNLPPPPRPQAQQQDGGADVSDGLSDTSDGSNVVVTTLTGASVVVPHLTKHASLTSARAKSGSLSARISQPSQPQPVAPRKPAPYVNPAATAQTTRRHSSDTLANSRLGAPPSRGRTISTVVPKDGVPVDPAASSGTKPQVQMSPRSGPSVPSPRTGPSSMYRPALAARQPMAPTTDASRLQKN
eukprot:c10250_g1_i1.p1 GENE.c10250_g1_i1~~c10250_g1_i1.p1  ORF type:complete len:718 (+),score=178.04 c10250_g1_i1:199-2154(+)